MIIPKVALKIIAILNEASYSAYFVGGCVRDMLMGKKPVDFDITTSARPEEVKKLFKKTIDTGIKHGTVTVISSGESYEVTTYRLDGKYADFRHPDEVTFTGDLKEDLRRRDFTVNAIAYHPLEGYIDFFGGKEDIEAKIIRGVGDPGERFREDALRMLRAVRFAARLGFDIEDETFLAIKENSQLISHVSRERIRDELIKALTSEYVSKCGYFNECEILNQALPFISGYLKGRLPAFINCISNMEKSDRTAENVLALLFKDYADEKELIKQLQALKLDNAAMRGISAVSKEIYRELLPSSYDIKKAMVRLSVEGFFSLLLCKKACGEDVSLLKAIGEEVIKRREPLFIKDMKINGHIIKEHLAVSGVQVGALLSALHDEILMNPDKNDEDYLLSYAKKLTESDRY